MTGYKSHLFVCTASPDKPGKCGHKGSEKLRAKLKEMCRDSFGKEVRVNSAGCLGYCESGITCALYSENKSPEWFLEMKDTDHDILYNAVKKSLNK